ncbi:NAD(P)/FAD-dependent oxidoreductase [Amycolatopsis anabasis]|uniref:NAD(P)/FAD-dependent oxidoreductase n=1 Tax=Amycolatopsis anabasis TaxID=1840409 RepID=UPI00131DDF00|nr:FAD-binding oxidoreductase [Amycolatopsis anabasis]
MEKVRVVVVGAGAVGLATALQLSETGRYAVTVLERQHVAEGSSSRSVGIIETQYVDEFDIAVRAFGLRFAQRLARDAGLRLTANGYLRLADSEETVESFELSVERQREHGIPDARVLTSGEVEKLVPFIDMSGRAGGLFGPSDGFVDGHLFTNLMGDLARRNGVQVNQRTRLRGASWEPGGAAVLATDRGEVAADYVVNAAGAWAGEVGDILGAPVTVRPQRHQAVTVILDRPLGRLVPSVMDYVPGSGRPGLYLRPEGQTKFFAGLHSEEALPGETNPDDWSGAVDPAFVEEIAESLAQRFTGHDSARLGQGWAGLFPMSADSHPVVGPHWSNERVICALGAGGNGIQLAPAIGRTVLDCLDGARPAFAGPGSAWDPARLAAPSHAGSNRQGGTEL